MGAVYSVLGMKTIVKLDQVCIDYYLDHEDAYSFKNAFLNFYAKAKKPLPKTFRALDHVSFSIKEGEKVGIIGLNGSGKTTLLRTLSGIFKPSFGQLRVLGNVSPLLDFQTGFDENLTGVENIKIRLMFLGLSKKEALSKIEEIAQFSELGDFIYQPIRTYSAGMSVRLAFATSTAIHPEILIADEIIGAGDAQFSHKAKQRMEEFLSKDSTMIISSHSMDLVEKFCDRIIWLERGKIFADGSKTEISKEYKRKYQ